MTRPTITVSEFEITRAQRAIDERCAELRGMGYGVHLVERAGPVAVIELVGDERLLVTLDPLAVVVRLRNAATAQREGS